MEFITASISKPGGRRMNEDYCSYSYFPNANVWVVADGMGGHHGGEIASKLAVESILEFFLENGDIQEENAQTALIHANNTILANQNNNNQLSKMQTTIVVLVSDGPNTITAHVGDSRCYMLRQGKIVKQTKDHSVVQFLLNQGEITAKEMRFHEDRNKVLRSLGNQELVKPSIHTLEKPLLPGDAFLLCTDGFWEYVLESEMEVDFHKASSPNDWLKRMETRLLDRASGEHDNYSAIAVFVQ